MNANFRKYGRVLHTETSRNAVNCMEKYYKKMNVNGFLTLIQILEQGTR